MQAMIASIERAEQIKESKMHKNSEEQVRMNYECEISIQNSVEKSKNNTE
jgi:hypothetical protein